MLSEIQVNGNGGGAVVAEDSPDVSPAYTNGVASKVVVNASPNGTETSPAVAEPVHGEVSVEKPVFLNSKRPVNDRRPLKIIQIGAGVSGIEMCYKIQSLRDIDLKIYEKNSGLGGTWFENRYPGCASDIPGHIYCYTWAPNPNWSKLIVSSAEILKYLQDVVEKHGFKKYMTFNHRVVQATWREADAKWVVSIARTSESGEPEIIVDECDVLISGTGILNQWKYPNIEGLKDYKGKLLHTANWDESWDWEGKTIAVLGSGASAIQVVPELQKTAKSLDVYIRSPTWMIEDPWTPLEKEGMRKVYSEEERARFNADPEFFHRYRKAVESHFNRGWAQFYKGSEAQAAAKERTLNHYKDVFSDKELASFMTPTFGIGCRRPTTGDPFVAALQAPNATTFKYGVTKMSERGIIGEDGVERAYDGVICATGFDASFTPRFPIEGRRGHELRFDFDNAPEAYMGLAVHGYPNFFMFSGPISPVGNGSAFPGAESTAHWIARFLTKVQEEGIRTFEVNKDAQDDFNEWVQAQMPNLVWTDGCESWYKHPKTGKVQVTWPGSMLHYCKAMGRVHYEHFSFDHLAKNKFDWLGNGLTWEEMYDKYADMAPYI